MTDRSLVRVCGAWLRRARGSLASVVREFGSFADQSDSSDESSAAAFGGRGHARLPTSTRLSASTIRSHVLSEEVKEGSSPWIFW